MSDPEVIALFLEELAKQRESIARTDVTGLLQALHGLKGSCAMIGLKDVGDAFVRIERRAHQGDAASQTAALELIDRTNAALRSGKPSPFAPWPEPPFDLIPRPIDPSVAAIYASGVADKLTRIDEALSSSGSDIDIANELYREIHALKGAALMAGDDVMAWFCHGLETVFAGGRRDAAHAHVVLSDMARYRAVLGELLNAPAHGLETLRVVSGVLRPSTRPSSSGLALPPRRADATIDADIPRDRPSRHETDLKALRDDEFVRVSSTTIDTLHLQVSMIQQDIAPLHASAHHLVHQAEALRTSQLDLRHALRLIGPPRPWGAPARALDKINGVAEEVERIAKELDALSETLSESSARASVERDALRGLVTDLRTTMAGTLFERVTKAMARQLQRDGFDVAFVTHGSETPIDRRVADALYDPIVQLIRNAAAHGIETAEERIAQGKPKTATVQLKAEIRAESIAIEVSDDGRGVDDAEVRKRAAATLGMKKSVLTRLPKAALLSLLFVPGFSTRSESDVLSGRGVGLDLALAAVHRLGGTIELSSRRGDGFIATILIPREGALSRIVWLDVGHRSVGVNVQATRGLVAAGDAPTAIGLAECLGPTLAPRRARPYPLAMILGDSTDAGTPFLIDGTSGISEVALRPLPPLTRLAGLFSACIVWGEELRFAIDVRAILSRAATLRI
jgi:two-component system, chemotaxis family, sensor kinase CheA